MDLFYGNQAKAGDDRMLDFLKEEGIRPDLIREIEEFRLGHELEPSLSYRVPRPRYLYYGTQIWEQALTALLCGEHLLLVGPKATGKNVFSQNLAAVFARPGWDIPLYINTDAQTLIGTDTFENGRVVFRRGPITECAVHGGFGILDEINMAKNEALAVLHATLDFRRIIDIPGYDKITLNGATRFIATMNYGYAGTRELNEALASRFMVIEMPALSGENLRKLLMREFPRLKAGYVEEFAGLFRDLQQKSEHAEISTKAVDLLGLLGAIHLMAHGLKPEQALKMGLTNKSFDEFERVLIEDIIRMRIPANLMPAALFEKVP